jgi:membrane-anchored protein YejM (alkaline phosphatase superfamily)
MIFIERKYLCFLLLKPAFCFAVALFICWSVSGQSKLIVKDTTNTCIILFYFHQYSNTKMVHPFTHVDYTRPNNQLMSWPNYPLTTEQFDERARYQDENRKLQSIIAGEILKSLLSKKNKVAAIPKF